MERPSECGNKERILVFFSAGCALIYLPAALSKFVNHVRIFHNTSVNYIPLIYERFYQNFYDNRQKVTSM